MHPGRPGFSVRQGTLEIGRATPLFELGAEAYPELSFWGALAVSPDDRGVALVKDAERIVGHGAA